MNADFDALASIVAGMKLYPEAKAVFPGSQEKKVRDFIENFFSIPTLRLRDLDIGSIKRLIVVDTKSPSRLGPLAEVAESKEVEVHLYDHHMHQSGDLHGVLEVIEKVGATATLFAEILKKKKLKPSPIEATLLMLGIYEETGQLLYPSTTERDYKAASYLLKCGANLNIVARYMKEELSPIEVQLLNECMATTVDEGIGGMKIITATASSQQYVGDAAHLCHRLVDITSADAAIMILRLEGKVLLVGRSRTPQVNISDVLEGMGGGGHPTAASATVDDAPLEIIRERVIRELERNIKPGQFAEHVMTSPVISIEHDSKVSEAEHMMTRFEVNVLPVMKSGKYLGLISREDLEKAMHHGFGSREVRDFANTDAGTSERYTPVREVERRMIERNQRFMPVIEDGKIIGAITRTDLLRALYENYLRRAGMREEGEAYHGTAVKNAGSWIRNRLPSEISSFLIHAGEIAENMGYEAFLVGGSVRDLMRSEENLDMDIVIEGDGIAFASKLASAIGGKAHPHERFKTSKVVTKNFCVDVATARTEHYETPASLPNVTASSIKKDLYRRDFTINTLAVRLNPSSFGRLEDYFGGQRDIKERSIRVLHNLSLVEDPTRAFRAVRFAGRFGFNISKHTLNLIRSAIQMKLFEKLGGTRAYDEMALIFNEADPLPIIRHLEKVGLLKTIHKKLALTEALDRLLTSVHDTLVWFEMLFTEEEPDRTGLYLTALLSELKYKERAEAANELSMPETKIKLLTESMTRSSQMISELPLRDRAKIYEALEHMPLESLLLAMALSDTEEKKKEISLFLLELRKVKTNITGAELKELGVEPGPVYGEILRALKLERLRGTLKSIEEEKEYVKNFLAKKNPPIN
jgi:tRNA nucleotidyltransferase (CCA-adding enzyme)